MHGVHGVGGSNPLAPTRNKIVKSQIIKIKGLQTIVCRPFFVCWCAKDLRGKRRMHGCPASMARAMSTRGGSEEEGSKYAAMIAGKRRRSKVERRIWNRKAKTPQQITVEGFSNKSLTMTYFHTGCSTIIGAESFHGPVRDGKGWYRLAMVIRHNLLICCSHVSLW